jgi:hypothetical protein
MLPDTCWQPAPAYVKVSQLAACCQGCEGCRWNNAVYGVYAFAHAQVCQLRFTARVFQFVLSKIADMNTRNQAQSRSGWSDKELTAQLSLSADSCQGLLYEQVDYGGKPAIHADVNSGPLSITKAPGCSRWHCIALHSPVGSLHTRN